jgi:hypothetical protein
MHGEGHIKCIHIYLCAQQSGMYQLKIIYAYTFCDVDFPHSYFFLLVLSTLYHLPFTVSPSLSYSFPYFFSLHLTPFFCLCKTDRQT